MEGISDIQTVGSGCDCRNKILQHVARSRNLAQMKYFIHLMARIIICII